MTITFKTVAKLAIGAIATVAAVHAVNKIIEKHYETDAVEGSDEAIAIEEKKENAKLAAEVAIAGFAVTRAAFRWFQYGMAYGAAAGAGYAIGNNLSMDGLIDMFEDKKARCTFMNVVQKVVRF